MVRSHFHVLPQRLNERQSRFHSKSGSNMISMCPVPSQWHLPSQNEHHWDRRCGIPITSNHIQITSNHLKSPRITQSQEGSGRFLEKFGWLGWPGGNSCTWSLGPFWSASWPCTKCLMACLMASISRALANKVALPEIKPFKTLLGFLKG